MKRILLAAFTILSFYSFSQLEVRKTIYEGKSYYEYPLKINKYASTEGFGVPVVFDSLPTGDYILKAISNEADSIVTFLKVDSGKVNGTVHLIDESFLTYDYGVLNGSYSQIVNRSFSGLEKGTYLNSAKSGPFEIFITKFYGGENGEDSVYKAVDGVYENGLIVGKYVRYYENGQVMFSCSNYKGDNFKNWSNPDQFIINKCFKNITSGKVKHTNFDGRIEAFYSNGDTCFIGVKSDLGLEVISALSSSGNSVITNKVGNSGQFGFHEITTYSEEGEPFKTLMYRLDKRGYYVQTRSKIHYKTGYRELVNKSENKYLPESQRLKVKPEIITCSGSVCDTVFHYTYSSSEEDNEVKPKKKEVVLGYRNVKYRIDSFLVDSEKVINRIIEDTVKKIRFEFYYRPNSTLTYSSKVKESILLTMFGFKNEFNSGHFRYARRWYCYTPDSILIYKDDSLFSGEFILKHTRYRKNEDGRIRSRRERIKLYSAHYYNKKDLVFSVVDGKMFGVRKGKDFEEVYKNGALAEYKEYVLRDLDRKSRLISKKCNFNYGRLNGEYKEWSYLKSESVLLYSSNEYELRFNNQNKDEEIKSYEEYSPAVYGLKQVSYYKNGKKEGVSKEWDIEEFKDSVGYITDSIINVDFLKAPFYECDSVGDFGLVSWVKNEDGKSKGFKKRKSGNEEYDIQYVNGNLNGSYTSLTELSDTNYVLHISNGDIAGEVKVYSNENSNLLTSNGSYKNSLPYGYWKFYRKSGGMSSDLYIDSVTMRSLTSVSMISSVRDIRNNLLGLDNLKSNGIYGTQIFYDVYGDTLSYGRLQASYPIGEWRFYNNKQLVEMHVYDSKVLEENGVKYWSEGTYKKYDKKGFVLEEGELLEGKPVYDCELDLMLTEFDRYVSNYRSVSRGQSVVNGTGMYELIDTKGVLREEGELLNRKKHKHWKFYDPNGNINAYGEFDHGLKTGVWISGDLRGIPFEDPSCFSGDGFEYDDEDDLEIVQLNYQVFNKGKAVESRFIKTYRKKI